MRTPILAALLATVAMAAAAPGAANPNPTHYQDAVAFHALGAIDQVTNFDAFVEGDITYIGDPYTDGQLTLTSTQNSVFGKDYPTYEPVRNVFANNFLEPIDVTIGGTGFNLFSFQIGDLVGDAGVTLWIDTNVSSFGLGIATVPTSQGFAFHGFLAPDGQYFTGFHFSANDDVTAPAFAEFELGHVPVAICDNRICEGPGVPEPATWALMLMGFGLLGCALRTERRLNPD